MKPCETCGLPEGTEPFRFEDKCSAKFCRANCRDVRADLAELDCLRRALANRDGEIANAAHILDSSGASKTSKDGAMLTLADRIATLHTSTIRRAHEAQESAAFIGAQHRMVWSALGGLNEESALDAAHRARSEVTRLESLLAIERGRVEGMQEGAEALKRELATTKRRLDGYMNRTMALQGDADTAEIEATSDTLDLRRRLITVEAERDELRQSKGDLTVAHERLRRAGIADGDIGERVGDLVEELELARAIKDSGEST